MDREAARVGRDEREEERCEEERIARISALCCFLASGILVCDEFHLVSTLLRVIRICKLELVREQVVLVQIAVATSNYSNCSLVCL